MANQEDYIRVTFRIPPALHERLTLSATMNHRSLNAECIVRLDDHMSSGKVAASRLSPAHDRIAAARDLMNEAAEFLRSIEIGD